MPRGNSNGYHIFDVGEPTSCFPDVNHVSSTYQPMLTIRQLAVHETACIGQLSQLLIDAVNGGASVGYLRPLSFDTARSYWEKVFANLADGLCLWVAEENGSLVGTVQFDRCGKENGRHRGEVQKLLVLSARRGNGIAKLLMDAVEAFAVADGRTLLVLDTQTGSVAEGVYTRLGWQKSGEIPDFAADPDGVLRNTTLFYKRLGH